MENDKKLKIEVFDKIVRIAPRISTNRFQGTYSTANQEWLETNVGTTIPAYRDGLNYYQLENGHRCHIYECSTI